MTPRDKKYLIFLITLIASVVFWWFRDGLILVPSETCYLINPAGNFYQYLFAWDSTFLAGYPILQMAGLLFPFKAFFILLGSLGISLVLSQVIYYILTLSLAGVSMYLLVKRLVGKNEEFGFAPIISSVFYVFNPFLLVHIINIAFLAVFSVLPLMMLFLIEGLETRSRWTKYSVSLSLCFMSLSTCTINFPHFGSVIIVLGLYLLYSSLITRTVPLIHVFKFILTTTIISALLSLFWIVPFALVLTNNTAMTPLSVASVSGWHQRGASSILDAFRLLGFWWWGNMPFAKVYNHPFMIISTLMVPVFSFSIICYRKLDKRMYFFLVLLLTGIFLVKAQHPPFEFIYKWATEHIWGFWIYREPYAKFSLISLFSYSVTLGLGIGLFYRRLIERTWARHVYIFRKTPFIVLSITLVLLSAWPMVAGYSFPTYRVWSRMSPIGKDLTTCHNSFVIIPHYYKQAAVFVKSDPRDYRILLTPIHKGGVYQRWELGYSGVTPEQFLFNKPVVIPSSLGSGSSLLPEVIDKIFNRNEFSSEPLRAKNVFKFLGLLNIRYIEQRDDFGEEFLNAGNLPRQSAKYMAGLLGSLPDISLEAKFGKLAFYENKYWLPRVYIDYSPVVLKGGIDILSELIGSGILDRQRSVFFAQDVLEINASLGVQDPEKVRFEKVNPTRFIVNIESRQSINPFWLVLSESFNSGWKAYIYSGGRRVELTEHKLINGYANAWLVRDGSLNILKNTCAKIVIEYMPQRSYALALMVSSIVCVACILYLIFFWRKS